MTSFRSSFNNYRFKYRSKVTFFVVWFMFLVTNFQPNKKYMSAK